MTASRGDPDRFAEVFDAFVADMWRYLAFHLGKQVAHDLVSEVFTRAFACRATFDPALGSARAWLYGIARNVRREWERGHTVELDPLLAGASPGESDGLARLGGGSARRPAPQSLGSASDPADTVAERSSLAAALARLDPDRREVVVMVAGLGLSYEETACALNLPIGTVRSRYFRARRQLRGLLARDINIEEVGRSDRSAK
jgi:RNA polymerase sigma-70 factor (ECF subfamily)